MNRIAVLFLTFIALSCAETVFEDDFSEFDPKLGARWMHFGLPGNMGNDGRSAATDTGALLEANVYQNQYRPPLGTDDDIMGASELVRNMVTPKLQSLDEPLTFPVAEDEVITFTGEFRVGISGTELHPFGDLVSDHTDDPRLATCGMIIMDPVNAFATCTVMSNNGIWTWHDVFNYPGFGGSPDPTPDKVNFVNWKRSGDRNASDFTTMQVEYNRKTGTIIWRELPSGKIHRVLDKPGLLQDDDGLDVLLFNHSAAAEPAQLDPSRFMLTWGCFIEMDKIDPNYQNCAKNKADGNPDTHRCGDETHLSSSLIHYMPQEFYKTPVGFAGGLTDYDLKNFGQGGNMTMRHISVDVSKA